MFDIFGGKNKKKIFSKNIEKFLDPHQENKKFYIRSVTWD